jgi:CRISPR/Cas system CSM-associated protein Csm2 small subunit
MSVRRNCRSKNHLRLVSQAPCPELPPLLANPLRRKQVEQLTEQLVEVLIEMMNIVDGDADTEAIGDECEDCDGV